MKQLLTFLCLIIGFNCIGQASCPTIVSYHTKPIGSGFKVYYTFVNPTNGSKSIELLIKDGSNIVFTTCINASGQQNVLRKDSTAVLAGNPDNMTIQWISHTNGSCGGGVCATSSVNPLPVKLTKFTANVTVSSVNLYWQSEVEDNLAYYEVEKSTNGSDYTLIGRVNGNNRASNYLFKDYYLDSGDMYYRLKIVDKNNSFEYSSTVGVSYSAAGVIKFYPNPVNNRLFFTRNTEYKLYTIEGKLLEQGNNKSIEFKYPSGTYFLLIDNNIHTIIK